MFSIVYARIDVTVSLGDCRNAYFVKLYSPFLPFFFIWKDNEVHEMRRAKMMHHNEQYKIITLNDHRSTN